MINLEVIKSHLSPYSPLSPLRSGWFVPSVIPPALSIYPPRQQSLTGAPDADASAPYSSYCCREVYKHITEVLPMNHLKYWQTRPHPQHIDLCLISLEPRLPPKVNLGSRLVSHKHTHHTPRAHLFILGFFIPLVTGCSSCCPPPFTLVVAIVLLLGATFSLVLSAFVATFPLVLSSPSLLPLPVGLTRLVKRFGGFSFSRQAAPDLNLPCDFSGEVIAFWQVCVWVWLVSFFWCACWGIFDLIGILLPFSNRLWGTCVLSKPAMAVLVWWLVPADATLGSPSILLWIFVSMRSSLQTRRGAPRRIRSHWADRPAGYPLWGQNQYTWQKIYLADYLLSVFPPSKVCFLVSWDLDQVGEMAPVAVKVVYW